MVDLGERFVRALEFATIRHGDQTRKGTGIPYVSHLLGTCSLVLEAGGNEDQAIAGLLHDTIEDGAATYAELVEEFGAEVADMVRECSDTEVHPKPPWRERKTAYLESLRHHSQGSILVSNADKLHNLRTIVTDYRQQGEGLWERFNADSDPLWYYDSLAGVFEELDAPLADELSAALDELKRLRASEG